MLKMKVNKVKTKLTFKVKSEGDNENASESASEGASEREVKVKVRVKTPKAYFIHNVSFTSPELPPPNTSAKRLVFASLAHDRIF